MKRLVSLLVVMAWAIAVPAVVLGAKADKVVIAHLAEVVEDVGETGEPVCIYYYNVIEVSENAVDAHQGHGDVLMDGTLPDGSTWMGGTPGSKFSIAAPCPE